jgi:hypothetical protein
MMDRFMVLGSYPRLPRLKRDGTQCRGTPRQEGSRRDDRSREADLEPSPPVAAHGRGLPQSRRPPTLDERIAEIDHSIAAQKRRLARSHRALREECGSDRALFAERWTAYAERCRFDELNELITQHNDWYPIERDLPMDLRTRDYVLINGRSYRRPLLTPQWVLEQFPAQ